MDFFYVKGALTGPTGYKEEAELLVNTGATLLLVPRPLAERLALTPTRSQRIVIAGVNPSRDREGAVREVWPVADVRLTLDGEETTTPCFIAPAGPGRESVSKVFSARSGSASGADPPLLGAVALESLFLAVDPVGKRLIPVEGFVG